MGCVTKLNEPHVNVINDLVQCRIYLSLSSPRLTAVAPHFYRPQVLRLMARTRSC